MRIGRLAVTATVHLDDGSTVSTPDDDRPFDRLLFERRFGEPWPIFSEDDKRGIADEHVLYMAWIQMHRPELAARTLTPDEFDTWLLGVASVDVDIVDPAEGGEDDAVLPTGATASTGG